MYAHGTNSTTGRGTRWRAVAAALALSAVCVALGQPREMHAATGSEEDALVVGVYDPEEVFTAYPHREQALARLQELAEEAIAAQQAGEQERFIEAQRRMEQTRERIVRDFERAVGEAAADVAEAERLNVVAAEVIFQAEGIETRDITEELAERLQESAAPEASPPEPGSPQAPDG